MKIGAFTKSFQEWSIPEVCHQFREIGLDGLDLTVRKKGHIEPVDVALELPLAAKAAAEAGSEILFLTTDIVDPTPEAEQLLKTASQLGITKIKLGYYKYQPFGNLLEQMDAARKRIDAVVKLCKPYGILPCLHVHSGNYFPSHGTMLYEMIKDYDPAQVGAYADMLHMALEGGSGGWLQGLDMLAPWIALVSVKNFDWVKGERDASGQQIWEHRTVPVADGISPVKKFVDALKKAGFDGLYSMHSEYKGRRSFEDLDTEACLVQTEKDLKFFKQFV